ncbi:hypothetical protein PhCBS80983_g05047 [Powellomyces hirtus]|uniref:RNA helicase n=1 Tax=Powellomyces hirtus TaxID=109895 RepID=A0A507DX60_9FUNG|nr:hypothetical protein PhCBS80983_g05047 [Powellomyces hirtus]
MDLFRALGAGAKFDKKRFRHDVEVFYAKRTNDAAAVPQLALSQDGTQVVAAELDFFAIHEDDNNDGKRQKDTKKEKDASEGGRAAKRAKLNSTSEEGGEAGKSTSDVSPPTTYTPFGNQELCSTFRKQHRIRVYGTDVPFPLQSFSELVPRFKLRPYLTRNLASASFTTPTPIQMQAIPVMLHARELMACAPTGSGKTLAYLLPILHELKGPAKSTNGTTAGLGARAVILCPTRELATQIHRTLITLTKSKPFKTIILTKTPTTSDNNQLATTFAQCDILISTPLRLVHAVQNQGLKLDNLKHLILDEADKLLELGFLDQIDDVLSICSTATSTNSLRKALFSATIPSGVEELAKTFMTDPIRVVIGTKNAATETINQQLLYVGQESGKLLAIRQLIQAGQLKPPCLIFVQSIDRAKELFHELVYDGIRVDVMHSERTRAQRDAAVQSFRAGTTWVLIATELMARGIDFKGVSLVVNYDFPQSAASYIHRIGRTGRAGREGQAITYFTKEDAVYLKTVVNVMRDSGCEVPEWMLQLKPPTKNEKKNLKQRALRRDAIKTSTTFDRKKIARKRDMVEGTKKRKQVAESEATA